ncbi:serine/threonine-protein kinase HipA [Conyzicola lurida]|uniref:Serine/threonine-protein kinase HipA n=1 Tax=Conyzicola lurida TaxID=1172621 RepID=A0A841AP36_9MICO|nr:HipA domain-containing protein [Conyzicola lurida]MBB5843315.1 serine/threonine-protein kinase HipA [Conyzicola lurida]
MTERIDVHLLGQHAAVLEYLDRERYRLAYNEVWRESDGPAISHSLPKTARVHTGRTVFDFLDNLLPDSTAVREEWTRQAGLSDADPFHLLAAHGADVAGALEFYPAGTTPRADGSFAAVSDEEIAVRIRAIRDNLPVPTAEESGNGYFSLGGAQGKFALALRDGGWHDSTGVHPSTHIFKPKVTGMVDGEIVEHVTMASMFLLGFPAAETAITTFAGEHSLVVTRFDREERISGPVRRIHQEDVAQALGVPRLRKYEKDGGPDYRKMLALLDRLPRASVAEAKERFVKSMLFSWLVLNTDAHAKNYSLDLTPQVSTLSPMYDVSSFLPYAKPRGDQPSDLLVAFDKTKLSMRVSGSYEAGAMGPFEWKAVARDAGLDPEAFIDWAQLLAATAPTVFNAVVASLPAEHQTPTVQLLVDRMVVRAAQADEQLHREVRV